jgi:hypothetical protein
MLLNAKKMAFLGLLLAITVLLIILSGVFEFNTLFLLAASSFGVGIAIRETNIRFGAGFYIAALLLSAILAPNKLYCITFSAMGLYIVLREYIFDKLTYVKWKINRKTLYWVLKYCIFNLMFLPLFIFLPKLIYQGELTLAIYVLVMIAGQAAFLVYDMAYDYFQKNIWGKYRNKL